jgi:curved DNA-binding protein CbpA
MAKTTLYDVLGVSSDATEEEIRLAFRRLTREYHPDRFQGEERQRAERRFQEITEAFNVLSRKESREKYDRELNAGGETALSDPREIARRLAAKGAQAYREGKLVEAADALLMAVHHDDSNGRAHYFLGLTLARLPGRQREGLRHIERAAMLEPRNAFILAEAAQQFLAAGLKSRARRFAQNALEADPTSSRARAVLDRLEGPGQQEENGGGLLGMFKRKG